MRIAEKEDGDEEGRGHKRKRKQSKCAVNDKSVSDDSLPDVSTNNFEQRFADSSPKRPKSEGDGKSKKYGEMCY